ncbi:RNA polymerase subunit sigma-24 [Prauserella marina]|uniref:RNA polymerase sigma-70 factor, ECF subfamily n=1 Tax=Prauserella marina TaxID=530584 RepID=A0A222VTL5_9PSEU|nr:RNA polymerase sigma factor SigJ [Prauserella marina]ASR37254.1 RNA polymerase subunit sigma-24 [Prauserella marina]PWV72583.1 RNA polymerase ECF family sigma subunit [Prauserella marina]SDD76624.1 RNA polymerase sigma-70 factor, ECF subfamily [Prauserella marina]
MAERNGADDASAFEFERHRRRLFGVAYRMLGSAADAEDVVQDTFLRWNRTEPASVAEPSAWLVKVTTNLCLNRLTSARHRRERQAGFSLPEPVLTSDGALGPVETAEQRDTVSLAFLVLADRLSPGERAVFVLREAFGYGHREIAELAGLSEQNSRQLHSRARKRLAEALPRRAGDSKANRVLVERFLAAARGGDLAELERMLTEDVVSVADGGETPGVARIPVRGAEKVARYLASVTGRYAKELTIAVAEVNGEPAILAMAGSKPVGVLVPEIGEKRITIIRIVADPVKLRYLGAQLGALSRFGS